MNKLFSFFTLVLHIGNAVVVITQVMALSSKRNCLFISGNRCQPSPLDWNVRLIGDSPPGLKLDNIYFPFSLSRDCGNLLAFSLKPLRIPEPLPRLRKGKARLSRDRKDAALSTQSGKFLNQRRWLERQLLAIKEIEQSGKLK